MSSTLIKVAANSSPSKVAGAIAGMIRNGDEVSVQTIGFGAMVRAVCAIGLATKFLEEDQYLLLCNIQPVEIDVDEDRQFAGHRFELTV